MEWRAYAVMRGRAELAAMVPDAISAQTIREVMDNLWQLFFPRWTRATGPMIAEAYIRGFSMVRRDEVPIRMIYRLADEHAQRVGAYFNRTSTDAMIEGFEKFVNKQVPRRVAMERVLESYGLSPRQVSGYVAADTLWPTKVNSATPIDLKTKIKQYISRSFQKRLGVFAKQEHHNLTMEAQQVAWMWMVENGKISEQTQKMWLTAKDEKVCVICGPMNAKKVGVREKFELPNGNELYVPGAHVNCRCTVKLFVNPFKIEKISKADWDPQEHPRGGNPRNRGQFSRKPPERPEVRVQERSEVLEDMLRQVREMQAQEPVIEEAPPEEKPKATFGPTAVFETPKAVFTEKPKASFREEPKEKPKAEFRVEKPKAEFKVEKPKAVFQEEKPVAGFWDKPKAEFDLSRIVEEEQVRQTAEQEEGIFTVEETVTYRPTRPLLGKNDEEGRGIVILEDPGQLTNALDEVELFPEIDQVHMISEPYRRDWIRRRVIQQHKKSIMEKLDEIVGDGQEFVEIYDEHDDREIYAEVPRDVVEDMLKLALKQPDDPMLHDERWDSEPAMDIDWKYSETDQSVEGLEGDQIGWADLARNFGLVPSSYEVVLVNMTEGYPNASRIDEETWNAPGKYIAANADKRWIQDDDGELIPYRVVDAVPDVREKTESIFGGITPEMRERWMRDHPGQDWPYG